MQEICKAFPHEWASMVPVLEYLYLTLPQGAHGFSAHDLTCGYALMSSTDRALIPFRVPLGSAETDIAARLFTNFRKLYGTFKRVTMEQAVQLQTQENRYRAHRTFEKGETVFRRMPGGSRPPKHLFAEASLGPYVVASQPTMSSVTLMDPATGLLVNNGALIPLDQIRAGPKRPPSNSR